MYTPDRAALGGDLARDALHAAFEIQEPLVEILAERLPRLSVDPRRRVLAEALVRLLQQRRLDVTQQVRERLSSSLLRSLSDPIEYVSARARRCVRCAFRRSNFPVGRAPSLHRVLGRYPRVPRLLRYYERVRLLGGL